jgi:hypothetical protein
MIKFIKKILFGTSATEPTPVETVKEILTPPAPAVEYIPPAKPVAKVRAISDSKPQAVKAATQPKPVNKNRKPRNYKPKAKTK